MTLNLRTLMLALGLFVFSVVFVACAQSADDEDEDGGIESTASGDTGNSENTDPDTDDFVPDTDTILPNPTVFAGQRSSWYGVESSLGYFPNPTYWEDAGKSMSDAITMDSTPAHIWIVGTLHWEGGCHLNFPSPGGSYPNISFAGEDFNEAYLTHFDNTGVKVWLQVESGTADMDDLIKIVMDRYHHHPSVIGFGVDVEWNKYDENTAPYGVAVTDIEAQRWAKKVRSYNSEYLTFFKHWLIDKMPPTYRNGLMFLNDSQDLGSLDDMVWEFKLWGKHFAPAKVGFQYGYIADKPWWQDLDYAPGDIGNELAKQIPNASHFYWVDFSLSDFWPAK